MDPIEVIVVANKEDRFCRSCESGRTMKEITASLSKQLDRRFGEAVSCRFIDISDVEQAGLPALIEEVHSGRTRLPVIAIGGHIRYRGLFSPTFIQRDIEKQLAARPESTLPKRSTSLSQDQMQRWRMRQLVLAMRPEVGLNRLSHVPPSGKR